jgi:hypothetical protein
MRRSTGKMHDDEVGSLYIFIHIIDVNGMNLGTKV